MPAPGAILLPNQAPPFEGIWGTIAATQPPPNAELGTGLAVAQGYLGPLNVPDTLYDVATAQAIFGQTSNMANLARQFFQGGGKALICIQPGSGGTAPTLNILDTTAVTPVHTNTVTALYPTATAHAFEVTIRADPINASLNDFLVYVEGILREIVYFTSGTGQAAALTAAVAALNNGAGSQYVTVTTVAAGNGTLADITQSPLATGVAPTQDTAAYTAVLDTLEQQNPWHVLVPDATTTALFAVIEAAADALMIDGYRRFAVCGEPASTALATSLDATNAGGGGTGALNDPLVLYTTGGFLSNAGWPLGTAQQTIDGYQLAARVAGAVSTLNPGNPLTAFPLEDATAVVLNGGTVGTWSSGQLAQIEAAGAIAPRWRNNRIMLSMGVTTCQVLTSPPAWAQSLSTDWKKVLMVNTIFYLFDAIYAVWEDILTQEDISLRPPNDKYGWQELINQGMLVVNQYIAQNLVQPGAQIVVDPTATALAIANGYTNEAVFDFVNLAMVDGLEIVVLKAQFGLNG